MKKTIFMCIFLTACSSTGVVPTDADTYMIAKRSAQVGFGPPDAIKADVYREANSFCKSKNKEVETISLEITNSGFAKPGSVSLTFRCK
jgi:hypothetical protein